MTLDAGAGDVREKEAAQGEPLGRLLRGLLIRLAPRSLAIIDRLAPSSVNIDRLPPRGWRSQAATEVGGECRGTIHTVPRAAADLPAAGIVRDWTASRRLTPGQC
jgi:hypothetical protein